MEQLVRITTAKVFTAAMLQLALTALSGDDEEPTFPWQNEPGKKLLVKTGLKTEDGADKYIDFLAFREVSDLKEWMTEPGRQFKGKLAFVPKAIMEIFSNEDWSGRPITGGEGVPFPQRLADYARHVGVSSLPSFFKTDRREPFGRPATALASAAGIQFRRGTAVQPGFTLEQAIELKRASQRKADADEKIRKRMRGMIPGEPKALRMIGKPGQKGKITAEQYRRWVQSFYFPQTQKIRGLGAKGLYQYFNR
jgi:hypothetical protein